MYISDSSISSAAFQRMPGYLRALREMKKAGIKTVSSVALSKAVSLNPPIVKKDLSYAIIKEGKPKVGYQVDELIAALESFLGYNKRKDAVLIGAGKLGQALLGYHGFAEYGLNIVAAFDKNENLAGTIINGKKIFAMDELESIIIQSDIKMAILTTPTSVAQEIAEKLVAAGIRAIWNFTPAHIRLPDTVTIKNENMAASLAVLYSELKEILEREEA